MDTITGFLRFWGGKCVLARTHLHKAPTHHSSYCMGYFYIVESPDSPPENKGTLEALWETNTRKNTSNIDKYIMENI